MKDKLFTAIAFAIVLAAPAPRALAAATPADLLGTYEPGTQLNRTREYMERQRALEQIEEDRAKAGQAKKPKAERRDAKNVPEVSFELTRFDIDASSVLAPDDIRAVASRYEGRRVKLAELYAFVNEINDLYSERGYATCRAILPPQRISGGVVKVRLVEGATGQVVLTGNEHTREDYVRDRIRLAEGVVANINELNEDITRFNATNDAQLAVALKAGVAVGTTDYEVTLREPASNHVFRAYADTNGYENNSRYRYGLMYTNRSLTGRRDSAYLSYMRSRGSDILGFAYSLPVSASGTRAELTAGYNANEIVNGYMQPLGVKGKAYNVGLAVRHPWVVTPEKRVEVSAEYLHQHSQTDLFARSSDKVRWVDGTTDKGTFSAAFTHYATWGILYHRHSLVVGKHKDIDNKKTDFQTYGLDSMYLKQFGNGSILSARFTAQMSFTSLLPSAQRFYLGGVASVRGYEEGLINGEKGLNIGIEYAVPCWREGFEVYGFFDAGRVFGKSTFGDKKLAGLGGGIKYNHKGWLSLDLAVGVPLKRTINEERQDSVRVHATMTATY